MDETPSSLSIRGRLIYTLSNSKHVFTHSTPFGQTGHMLRNDVWTLFYFHYMSKKYSLSKEQVNLRSQSLHSPCSENWPEPGRTADKPKIEIVTFSVESDDTGERYK